MVSGKDESADRPGPASTPGADAGNPAGQPGTEGTGQPGTAGAGPTDSPFGAGIGSGAPDSEFGPPLAEFGPSLKDFGPSMNEPGAAGFGPATEAGMPVWTPAPGATSPELAWRPADQGGGQGGSGLAWRPADLAAPGSANPDLGWRPADPAAGVTGPSNPEPGWGPADAAPGAAAPANPEFGWRPADSGASGAAQAELGRQPGEAAPVDPPPMQYRAPDSWTPQEAVSTPAPDAAPADTGAAEGKPAAGWDESAATTTGSWWRSAPSGFPPVPPDEPVGGESLSWADDPIAKRLAPKPVAAPPKAGKPWKRIGLLAGAAAAVLALVAVVVVAVTSGGDSDESPLANATTMGKPGASTTVAQLSCPARREGALTIGNGEGGTDSGAAAILGFQHAFYVERNGVKAHSFVAPDTPTVSTAETIQSAGIDQTPAGTTYCVRISEIAPETYDADLTVHSPDGTTAVYRQRIVTVNRDGKHLIFTIEERQS
ncbi:hypothetical protein [Nocardia inohanensis]|uniref:hypothetical protein n=1 Tax=Nocardia inohanensis TaxID=209246 RepID=UPI00082D9049|nr:hypothetical protein [Nocardia inohanensis]